MISNVERIASHLQGAAAIRRWTVDNIPSTESGVGYDVFIKIASDYLAGIALNTRSLLQDLPYPEKQIRQQLAKLIHTGLLAQHEIQPPLPAGTARTKARQNRASHAAGRDTLPIGLIPTPRFESLLNAYVQESDRVYAVRQNLRGQQLVVADADQRVREFIDRMYDHFHDLGWLYLHNFGAVCFLMTSLVCLVARSHGYRARMMSGYVEVVRAADEFQFLLGANAPVNAGQIPGHAFCVLEESLIVDFGIGNLRRAYHRDFPWGLSCAYRPQSPQLGSMVLANGDRVTWKDDWQYPETPAEFAKFEGVAAQLALRYARAFGAESRLEMQALHAPDSAARLQDRAPPPSQPSHATLSATR